MKEKDKRNKTQERRAERVEKGKKRGHVIKRAEWQKRPEWHSATVAKKSIEMRSKKTAS